MKTLVRGICGIGLIMLAVMASTLRAQDASGRSRSDQPPVPIEQSAPIFPFAMISAGLEGSVTVELIVTVDGRVREAHIVKSNNPWFERPALDAVMRWKFKPAIKNGRAVQAKCLIEMPFTLGDGGDLPWKVGKQKNPEALPPELRWYVPPVPTHTMFPVYPFDDLDKGVSGRTKIAFVVGHDGRVQEAKVLEATTPEMGMAVLAMIDAWQFKPARKKDKSPALAALVLEHKFALRSGDAPVSDSAREILALRQKSPQGILAFSDLDQPPRPISQRPPAHPSALKKSALEGEAVIEFYLDPLGDAQLPRIISATAPEFGYAAAQAVATWRFTPPTKAGKPVVARTRIPVKFTLQAPRADRKNDSKEARFQDSELPRINAATATDGSSATPASPGSKGYTVNTLVVINEQGEVDEAKVGWSGEKLLNDTALQIVRGAKFQPRIKDGVPVKFRATLPVFFPIEDDGGKDAQVNSKLPQPRAQPAPKYPPQHRKAGVPGVAIMQVRVDDRGSVAEVKPLRATDPAFAEAAGEAIAKWKFAPPKVGGKAVASNFYVAVDFQKPDKRIEDWRWLAIPRPRLGTFVIVDHAP